MKGVPDRPTPINLANHNYYNLCGGGTVKDHIVCIAASDYTPTRQDLIPTGEIAPVEGTPLDFREPREIGDTELDANLVLDAGRDAGAPAAQVECPRTGAVLELWTAEPGLQVFDAFAMTIWSACRCAGRPSMGRSPASALRRSIFRTACTIRTGRASCGRRRSRISSGWWWRSGGERILPERTAT